MTATELRKALQELASRMEGRVREAFEAAISGILSEAEVGRLERAIRDGSTQGVMEALHLEPEAYWQLDLALEDAFREAGVLNSSIVPRAAGIVFRFNMRNQRAETWLRRYSSSLIDGIIDAQREAIQEQLAAGLERGDNPRRTALQIVGRVDPKTQRRDGGIIGLSRPQAEFVRTALEEITSGDPKRVRNYLKRERRDARFDRTVIKALKAGKGVTADVADYITGRYADGLLALRGESIGRTETMAALGEAQQESLLQAVQSGAIRPEAAKIKWRSAGDNRVRHTHSVMNGQIVPVGTAFLSPSGASLRYPGDPRAPAHERIMCRCWTEPVIDYFMGVK